MSKIPIGYLRSNFLGTLMKCFQQGLHFENYQNSQSVGKYNIYDKSTYKFLLKKNTHVYAHIEQNLMAAYVTIYTSYNSLIDKIIYQQFAFIKLGN